MSNIKVPSICVICGRRFKARREGALYCSEHCRHKAFVRRRREKSGRGAEGDMVRAVCKECGCEFTYKVTCGRPRTKCDRCRGVVPKCKPRRIICLFCGVSDIPKHGGEFCDACVEAGLDGVYRFRKAGNGGWRSEGDKARERGEANASRNWLADATNGKGTGNQRRHGVGALAEFETQSIKWAMKARGGR